MADPPGNLNRRQWRAAGNIFQRKAQSCQYSLLANGGQSMTKTCTRERKKAFGKHLWSWTLDACQQSLQTSVLVEGTIYMRWRTVKPASKPLSYERHLLANTCAEEWQPPTGKHLCQQTLETRWQTSCASRHPLANFLRQRTPAGNFFALANTRWQTFCTCGHPLANCWRQQTATSKHSAQADTRWQAFCASGHPLANFLTQQTPAGKHGEYSAGAPSHLLSPLRSEERQPYRCLTFYFYFYGQKE